MQGILIVGATSTIAADVARLYAQRGAKLYLVARNKEKLSQLETELGSAVLGAHVTDFLNENRHKHIISVAQDALGTIDVALIAHGYLGDQELSERVLSESELIIQTNYTSVVSFLLPLANAMAAKKNGQITVLSSVAGQRGRPRNYTYGSAKAATTVYLQGLRSRLWPHVKVTTILLGPVDTAMTVDHTKTPVFTSSKSAAKSIVRATDSGRGEVYVPGYWRPILAIVRNLPEVFFQKLSFLADR